MQYVVSGMYGLPLARHPQEVQDRFEPIVEGDEVIAGYRVTICGESVWFPYEPYIEPAYDPDLIFDERAGVWVWIGHSAERYLPKIIYQPLVA